MWSVDIPVDIFDSPTEFVVVIPLWWVEKSSVQLSLQGLLLTITWTRMKPDIKDSLSPVSQKCYRWTFKKVLEIPSNSYFNNIHSELSPTNILTIIVPKVIVPESITVLVK